MNERKVDEDEVDEGGVENENGHEGENILVFHRSVGHGLVDLE